MKILIIGKKIKILFGLFIVLIIMAMAYRYFPYKIEYIGYYDKIWAHRVNSEEKLNSALKFFKGVEVDLVYDETKNTDRKSTRLNSSHVRISYAVFCLKK